MKTMTCNQLGGACDVAFQADTFDQIADQSRQHAMQMLEQADQAHLDAMARMKAMMQQPGEMEKWFEARKREFEALPDE